MTVRRHVSSLVKKLAGVKKGAMDLISFAGIVALHMCPTVEGLGTRYMEIARQLNGTVYDICDLSNFGPMLDNALGNLLQPLSSFPLSAHPRDPASIAVTVNGAAVSNFRYDAATNRIVFPVQEKVSYSDDFGAARAGGRKHQGNDLMGAKLDHELAAADGVISWVKVDD